MLKSTMSIAIVQGETHIYMHASKDPASPPCRMSQSMLEDGAGLSLFYH